MMQGGAAPAWPGTILALAAALMLVGVIFALVVGASPDSCTNDCD